MRRTMIKSAVCIVVFAVLFARAHAQSTDSPRKLINNKPPQYPAFLKSMKLEGNVRLRVTVAPNGTPKSSEVLGGNPAFAKAAQDAVANWKWVPAPEQSEVMVNFAFHPKLVEIPDSVELFTRRNSANRK